MNFIDKLALYFAKSIRDNYSNAASLTALQYSLSLVINTSIAFAIVMALSIITGKMLTALSVIFIHSLLRHFSGGVHMPTSLSCCIFSIILFSAATHITFDYKLLGFSADFISLFVIILKAPTGLKNFSRIDEKYYPLLKIISILIIVSNFFVQSPHFSIIFLAQSFMLLDITYKTINTLGREGT